jgi:uncharacterized protein
VLARQLAAGERGSLGSAISELARRGLTPARVEADDGLPVIRVPAGTPPSRQRWCGEHSTRIEPSQWLRWTSTRLSRWHGTRTCTTRRCALVRGERPRGMGDVFDTESGFVRVSSDPIVLPSAIGVDAARGVVSALRMHPGHQFLTDDVSMSDGDVPPIAGYRQVTDAHLLTLSRRRGVRLVTFDASMLAMGGGDDVEVLTTL